MLKVKFTLYSPKKCLNLFMIQEKDIPHQLLIVINTAGRLNVSHKSKVLGTCWTLFCRYHIPASVTSRELW